VIVRAPNKAHNGRTAGVQFRDGVGETDNPAALAYFQRAGYEVTAGKLAATPVLAPKPAAPHVMAPGEVRADSPFAPGAVVAPKPLERMNKTELQAIAGGLGLDVEGTNRELVARIRAAQA
jgi:hypothetical protein